MGNPKKFKKCAALAVQLFDSGAVQRANNKAAARVRVHEHAAGAHNRARSQAAAAPGGRSCSKRRWRTPHA